MALKVKSKALSKLKFGKAEPKTGGMAGSKADPKEAARNKFLAAVEVQRKIIDTPDFTIPANKYENGVKVEGAVAKPRRWWFYDDNGVIWLKPKYGVRDLVLDPNNPVIQCGKKESDIKPVLDALKEAAEAGDLDDALLEVAKAPKRKAA